MKKQTMCPTKTCEQNGQPKTVQGGCEICGATLVDYIDSNVPTIKQIALIICDVSRLEGVPVPEAAIEVALRSDKVLHDAWLARLAQIDWKYRLQEIQDAMEIQIKQAQRVVDRTLAGRALTELLRKEAHGRIWRPSVHSE